MSNIKVLFCFVLVAFASVALGAPSAVVTKPPSTNSVVLTTAGDVASPASPSAFGGSVVGKDSAKKSADPPVVKKSPPSTHAVRSIVKPAPPTVAPSPSKPADVKAQQQTQAQKVATKKDVNTSATTSAHVKVTTVSSPSGVKVTKETVASTAKPQVQKQQKKTAAVVPLVKLPTVNTGVAATHTKVHPNYTIPLTGAYKGVFYAGSFLNSQVDESGKCFIWGNPAFVNSFDGGVYSFAGKGEFVAFAAKDGSEQVNIVQSRSGRASRVTGVALFANKDVISVVASASGSVDVFHNKAKLAISFSVQKLGTFEVIREASGVIALTSSTGTRIAILKYHQNGKVHLDVAIQVSPILFKKTQGLCGSFSFKTSDDMVSPEGKTLPNVTSFAKSWHITPAKRSNVSAVRPALTVGEASISSLSLVSAAKTSCVEVAPLYQEACVLNVLQGGSDAVNEVLSLVRIISEGQLSLDTDGKQCAANPSFNLGLWSPYSICSKTCTAGIRQRTRDMLVNGIKCGVMTQKISCRGHCVKAPVFGKCVLWGAGHMVTFDRMLFNFHGTGEYTAYEDLKAGESVHVVRYRPKTTASVTYDSGVAVRFGADVFAAQLLAPTYDVLQLTFNRKLIILSEQTTHHGFFTIRQFGKVGTPSFMLEIKLLGGTTVTLSFANAGGIHHVNTYIEVGGSKLGDTRGLCGVFDFNQGNEFTNAKGVVDVDASSAAYSWALAPTRSYFSAAIPMVTPSKLVELNATKGQLSNAQQLCKNVDTTFKNECVFDTLFSGSASATADAKEVASVVDGIVSVASSNGTKCLLKPGTTLGSPSAFSACSRPCGGGFSRSSRAILAHNGVQCGIITDAKACNTQVCPKDCALSTWSDWSHCSLGCGSGNQTRTRRILVEPVGTGRTCAPLSQVRPCTDSSQCCKTGNWTTWGRCDAVTGTHNRTRFVNFAPRCGHKMEVRPCCDLSTWSEWSECADGKTRRTRMTQGNEATCAAYPKEEVRPCCKVEQYSEYSQCTNGTQTRTRMLSGDTAICATWKKNESRACCSIGAWSTYSICSNGVQNRTRILAGDAAVCKLSPASESRSCCQTSAWRPWGACLSGKQTRSRHVQGGSVACANTTRVERRSCCVVGLWETFGACTNGTHSRRRNVVGDATVCARHAAVEVKPCCNTGTWTNWTMCSNNHQTRNRTISGNSSICQYYAANQERECCLRGPWSVWTACDASTGKSTRSRSLTGEASTCAVFEAKQEKTCCSKSDWSSWSKCEDGQVTRTRSVVGSCSGVATNETKRCCHVGPWSDFGACKDGQYSRSRNLTGDDTYCKQWATVEKKQCCELGEWADWSECQEGIQHHSRNVSGSPTHCGGIKTREMRRCCKVGVFSGWSQCVGGSQTRQRSISGDRMACMNYQPVEKQPCCVVKPWKPWSQCEKERQFRLRDVEGHSGCSKEFNKVEYRRCKVTTCIPGAWTPFSACANGTRKRTRVVYGAENCTLSVPTSETAHCSDVPHAAAQHAQNATGNSTSSSTNHTALANCKVSTWSTWSGCQGGFQVRTRTVSGGEHCADALAVHHSKPCPCKKGEWGPWEPCSDDNTQTRRRFNHGGCHNVSHSQDRSCCKVSAWGLYGECAANGLKTRTRTVSNTTMCLNTYPVSHDAACCFVGAWSNFTRCVDGQKIRHRSVAGPVACTSLHPRVENASCCEVSPYTPWSICSIEGKQERTRTVLGGRSCAYAHPRKESRSCCHLGEWTAYSPCLARKQQRTRKVTGNPSCQILHKTKEIKQCTACSLSKWTEWSPCSGMAKTRTRTIAGHADCHSIHKAKESSPCAVAAASATTTATKPTGTMPVSVVSTNKPAVTTVGTTTVVPDTLVTPTMDRFAEQPILEPNELEDDVADVGTDHDDDEEEDDY